MVGRLALTLASLVAGMPPAALAQLTPGDHQRVLRFGDVDRPYDVHVPPGYDGAAAVPLVVDIHGFTSNKEQQAGLSGMKRVADREGFIVVLPQGIGNSWNAGNLCCGIASRDNVDDVGFLRAVVSAIVAEATIDQRRVYVSGLSNGGGMTHTLACEAADLFAAAAPLAFPLPYGPLTLCQPSRPIPMMTFMGLTDVLVPYDGGGFPSAADTFAYWRDLNGCTGTEPDETVVTGMSRCETYTQCAGGVQTALCSITARAFPGTFFSGHILYFNDDLDLAETAWDFMSQFTLPQLGRLTGTDRLRIGGLVRLTDALEMQFGLAGGRWWAEDQHGNRLAGSYLERGPRRLDLALTEASRATLVQALQARAMEASGTALAITMTAPEKLRAHLNRARTRVKLQARLGIMGDVGGETKRGRYVFRIRGTLTEDG
jgi:polyhydroxybutyrate depolymerase